VITGHRTSQVDQLFGQNPNRRRGQGGGRGNGGSNGGGADQDQFIEGAGSGFIIDKSGFILTNNHVVEDADTIAVKLDGMADLEEGLPAKVVGRDQLSDVALLQLTQLPKSPLPEAKFGDSAQMAAGDWVMAIGNPFELSNTVTVGVVSSVGRPITKASNSGTGIRTQNMIQTDAAINRGNSGGPLFNLDGEVVGVNTAIISPSGGSIGIGFAVPATTAVAVIDQLREFKEVRRGWLGVRIQQVTDEVAEKLNVKPARGALVAGIDDKGPAKPAGIGPGDVIVKFDGKDVKEMRDLPRIVATTPIGKDVDVVIVHKGKEETKRVKLGRLDDNEKQAALTPKDSPPDAKPALKKTLGIYIAGITDALRKKHKIEDSVKGVVITAIDPASPAAEKRLTPGMVIAEVDQQPVNTPAEFQSRIDALQKDGKSSAMLMVLSPSGDSTIVVLGLK